MSFGPGWWLPRAARPLLNIQTHAFGCKTTSVFPSSGQQWHRHFYMSATTRLCGAAAADECNTPRLRANHTWPSSPPGEAVSKEVLTLLAPRSRRGPSLSLSPVCTWFAVSVPEFTSGLWFAGVSFKADLLSIPNINYY